MDFAFPWSLLQESRWLSEAGAVASCLSCCPNKPAVVPGGGQSNS